MPWFGNGGHWQGQYGDGKAGTIVGAAHLTCRSSSDTAGDRIAQQGKNDSRRNPSIQLAYKHRGTFLSLQMYLGDTLMVSVVVVYR